MWRPVVKFPLYYPAVSRVRAKGSAYLESCIMASLSLKNVKKIYPHNGDEKKAKKKRGIKDDEIE